MDIILSQQEVRNCDKVAIERYGIAGMVLMENAGGTAGRYIYGLLGEDVNHKRIRIIAGGGNNGGDGFVVARHLDNAGVNVEVLLCYDRSRIKGDALINLGIIEKMAIPVRQLQAEEAADIAAELEKYIEPADIIVDAMLGTGVSGPAREPIRSVIETVNRIKSTNNGIVVVALDIPSGLNCDTGRPLGELQWTIKADYTITFAAMKKGFAEPDARNYTGKVTVASIGINVRRLLD